MIEMKSLPYILSRSLLHFISEYHAMIIIKKIFLMNCSSEPCMHLLLVAFDFASPWRLNQNLDHLNCYKLK